jgi:hypothetical protein
MYTTQDFKTKKELIAAVKAGHEVYIYQPGPFGGKPIPAGNYAVEGPHYPKPHTWYAQATVEAGGKVVKVK